MLGNNCHTLIGWWPSPGKAARIRRFKSSTWVFTCFTFREKFVGQSGAVSYGSFRAKLGEHAEAKYKAVPESEDVRTAPSWAIHEIMIQFRSHGR